MNTPRYDLVESPVGPLRLAADDDALLELQFMAGPKAAATPAGWVRARGPVLREARRQLEAYFAGKLEAFDLPLKPPGTAFQQSVWQALRTIPYGVTCSYGAIARQIGQPAASRAVGLANGRNPIAIIVPCHRVIGANGSLTGFGGGLPIKQALLELEGAQRGLDWAETRALRRAG
jgi:methylated-DNA-[protein]-cysteine S-methyltransferase